MAYINTKRRFAFLVFTLTTLFLSGRVCAQSLGDPIVDITFGAGTATRSGPLSADSGSTTYTYSSSGFPNDDDYTIANTTAGMFNGWWTTTDHTGNTGGYMMIVNGSYDPGTFYTRTVTGLCGGTQYQFAAWIKNLLNYNGILPNVTFSILTTDGTVLGTGNTGDIAEGDTWIQYPFTFTTPANTGTIVIKMSNNANGGIGNDIAIDDITFRPYGAPVSVTFNQSTATTATYCAGTSHAITISTTTTLANGYEQKVQELINGVWTDQTGGSTSATFTVNSPTTAGTYYYRVVTALTANISSSECLVSSNELTLIITPSPTAAFTVAANTCLGTATVFTDASVSNGSTISSWLWDFGDGTTSTLQNPSHTYTQAGDYTVTLTLPATTGCTVSTATKNINIISLPVAAFTYSTPDCLAMAITLTDNSTAAEGIIVSWVWNYGDGTNETKTTNAPFQHTYSTAGTYIVTLVITTATGCSATTTQTITVSPFPLVNFTTPDVCLADASATFINTTTIAGNATGTFTYLWNFGDANATSGNSNSSTLESPSHKYSQEGIYSVSLTVTSPAGCTAGVTKSFTVNGSVPVADFKVLNSTELCSSQMVSFTNASTVDFGSITKIELYYDYGNNPTVAETDNSPYYGKVYTHTYTEFHSPASVNYQVRMLAYSGISCVAEKDETIKLLATPAVVLTVPASICQDAAPVQLTASETSGVAGTGVFSGTGVSSSGYFNPAVAGAGTFIISYLYTSSNGCTATASQSIRVNTSPAVSVVNAVTILAGGSVTLEAKSAGDSLTYSWSPATGLSSTTVLDPVASPAAETTYTITATNLDGCSASAQVTVNVLQSPLIPNTFTPNGDGVNDTWNIKYLDSYPDCTVQIFNRWGTAIYSSVGYPSPWDGRYNSQEVPAGVYYYLINPKHGRKAFSGWVTIIR